MTTPIREELFQKLADLQKHFPDVRFGQLIANLAYFARGHSNEAIWDVEDEELLQAAKEHLEQRRTQDAVFAVARQNAIVRTNEDP